MFSKQISNTNHEIEFLRAISVLFVIFFHFELLGFKGGFVGVDIFFVISGYLITSIILKNENFNLLDFYLRRIRRLLPIILLVCLICLIVSFFVFSPIHFNRLLNSSLFTILGISNFFFFSEAGYFDHEKLFKPLLHTWSLSIELQFYLIWPVIFLLYKKFFKFHIFYLLCVIFFFSILLSILYSSRTDSFFYFTGFRIYEFAIGSILYFIITKDKVNKSIPIFFIFGLIMILISVFLYDSSFKFPGIYALVPCLGSALIIYSRFSLNNYFGKYIKLKIIKLLGSTSYTIYMLHWPFLIFYSYHKMSSISIFEKIIIIFIVLISSFFIFKYFEQPFRFYKKGKSINLNQLILKFLIFIIFIIFSLKFLIDKRENYLFNKSFYENQIITTVMEGVEKRNIEENKIFLKHKNQNVYFNNNNNKKRIMLLGNSHAFDFYMALNSIDELKTLYDIDYIDFEYLHCFKIKKINDKILDYVNYEILKRKNSCEIVFNQQDFKILNKVENLILGSRWPLNTDFNALIDFFDKFNLNIIIVGNGHKFYDVPTLYFKRGNKINLYAQNFNHEIEKLNNRIKNITKNKNIKFFDKSLLNCNPNCVVFDNNTLLYSDKDHWSYKGANYFGNKIYLSNFLNLLN